MRYKGSMSDLNEMLVFARVVEQGSFIGASRVLGQPKTTVSRKVQELEKRLGARLLQRTTRSVAPTEAGRVLYEHCKRIFEELAAAEAAVGHLHGAPRGRLQVSTSFTFGVSFLAPLLPAFLARYPDVRVSVVLDDGQDDPIGQGTDVAIRTGVPPERRFACRALGNVTRRLYAAPEYLRRRGEPVAPADLGRHDALALGTEERGDRTQWHLTDGVREEVVPVSAVLLANDPMFLVHAALAGQGIAKVPDALCREHLAAGRLKPVLPGWAGPAVPLSALYPSRQSLAPKVRVFLDFLVERLEGSTLPVRRALLG